MKYLMPAGLVITMIFLSAATSGQAQAHTNKKIDDNKRTTKTYLDLVVNAASTNLDYGGANSGLAKYKQSNNGVQAGASFQAGITPAFSLVSALYFMRKGGRLKANNPLTTGESNLRLNTIELPVLARFHFGKCFINAGPSIAYTLSGNRKIVAERTKLSFTNSADGFKRFDAGVQMGGGVELPFKQRSIVLDIRYHYGLTNISYNNEIYNRALMISVHFSTPWKTNPLERNTH